MTEISTLLHFSVSFASLPVSHTVFGYPKIWGPNQSFHKSRDNKSNESNARIVMKIVLECGG